MSDLVYLKDEGVNAIHPEFERRFATVKANFFSRNPDLWPVFREPGFATLNEFRARGLAPAARLNAWPDGRARLADLCETMPVPATMRTPGEPMAELLFAGALSKDWENPSSVENVITMSADPPSTAPRWAFSPTRTWSTRICRGGRGAGEEGGAPDSTAGGLRSGPCHRHLHPGDLL